MTTFYTPLNRNLWTKDVDGIPTIEKEEDSVLDYSIDFTNDLAIVDNGATISSVSYDASGVTVDSSSLATPVATVTISSTNGTIKATATTSNSKTIVKRLRFRSPNTGRRINDYDYSS